MIIIVKHLKDITKLRWVEEALQVSEEKYRPPVENVTALINTINRNGNFISINDMGLRYWDTKEMNS